MTKQNIDYQELAKKATLISANHTNKTKKELAIILNESLRESYSNPWTALYNAIKGGFELPKLPKGKTGPKTRKF